MAANDFLFPESIEEAHDLIKDLNQSSPRPTIGCFCSCMRDDGSAQEIVDRDIRLRRLSFFSYGLYSDYKRKCVQLKKEVMNQKQENEELKQELQRRNNTIKGLIGVKETKPEDKKEGVEKTAGNGDTGKKQNRKKGAPKGHNGASRKVPENIDRVENIQVPGTCPDCGGTVENTGTFDKVVIEDIVTVVKEIVQCNLEKGKCCCCGKEVRHPYTFGPPVRIGESTSAILAAMRQTLGVSYSKLARFSSEYFDIQLTESGVYGIVSRAADKTKPVADLIKFKLPEKEWLNIDETGWKNNGKGWYMWGFFDDTTAVYHPAPTRSSDVPKEILGKDFKGIVIADFYAAYNFLKKTQRCLVHYLRDICDELKITPNCRFLRKMKKNCKAIIKIAGEYTKNDIAEAKMKKKATLAKKLFNEMLKTKPPQHNKVCINLSKRLKRFENSILMFLEMPGIDCHNNRAERMLRPVVLFRKNSFGNRTDKGAERYGNTATVIETARLQGYSPMQFMKELIKPFADITMLAKKLL